MYFSKKGLEPVQTEQTSIWTCNKEGCTCWMRDALSFKETPTCPICSSTMVHSTKMLPVLNRH
ncbi:MAG: cold-shock protein [Paenibacillaceae bacterium]